MITQPPNPEAVEAAMRYLDHSTIGDNVEIHRIIHENNPWKDSTEGAVASILAAEVERLRARVAELESERPAPAPLPRPDRPGWWWCWEQSTPPRWVPIHVHPGWLCNSGIWIPAPPPPAPTQEASND